jgi:hypothetical protein
MKMLNFNTTKEDDDLIMQIVVRADPVDRISLAMDLTACHLNGTPLDLPRLLVFPDGSFWHDINGIQRHLDRETGQLTGGFLPRCAINS